MIDSETTWRGGEGQLALLMGGLLERDVEVTLAAAAGSAIAERAEAMGVPCEALPIAGGMDLAAVSTLTNLLSRETFDIVHCHSSHAHSVAFLAKQARRLTGGQQPMLVVSRRVDFPVGKNAWSALKYRYGVDRYLAISNGVRDVLIDGGVSPDKIDLVRSGIELAKFDKVGDPAYLKEEFSVNDGTFVVGNVAALAPHKSQVDFIRAASIVAEKRDNVRFFIAGEGELRPELEAEIERLDLGERLIMTGFRSDVLELLSMFNCFVLSSYLEGLCTSIMDAQALGVAVVATDTGGVPDLVTPRETGLLVPVRSPEALASAIIEMMDDDELRETCARNALKKSKTYDYNHMVDGTLAAYRALTQSRDAANVH